MSRVEMAVVKMLDHAKLLGILEDVSDEGKFWEKRDVRELVKQVGQMNQLVADWAGQLKDWFGEEVASEITQYPDFEHLEARGRR
jgi:hypothetical protein